MPRNFIANWAKLPVLAVTSLVAAVIALTSVSREAMAAVNCLPVNGHLKEQQVPCPSLCTTGRMNGGIQGTYNFTLTSLSPVDPAIPTVVHFSGLTTITTQDGDLNIIDAGGFDTASPGNFANLMTIVGGTGALTGASGHLFLFGDFDPAMGTGASDYRGEVCIP